MDLTTYVTTFISFVNNFIIPFLIGIALLMFIINVIRYFVIGGGNQESQEKARSLALYGVLAFVFLLVFWGIVNMFGQAAGLARYGGTTPHCFDYDPSCVPADPSGRVVTGTGGTTGIGGAGVTPDGTFTGGIDPTIGGGGSLDTSGFTPPATIDSGTGLTTPNTLGSVALPDDAAAAIANAANNIATVQDAGTAFTGAVTNNYDFRIAPVVQSAVAAVNDPNATPQDQAVAAARLRNIGVLTDQEFSSYINTLNAQTAQAGQPVIDVVSVGIAAGQPSQALIDQQNFTYQSSMLPAFTDANDGWLTLRSTAQAQAQQQIASIQQTPAGPARLAAYDQIVANGSFPNDGRMNGIRQRLIGDIDAELFFQGQPPLSQQTPAQPAQPGIDG